MATQAELGKSQRQGPAGKYLAFVPANETYGLGVTARVGRFLAICLIVLAWGGVCLGQDAAAKAAAETKPSAQPLDRVATWLESLGSFESLSKKSYLTDELCGYGTFLRENGIAGGLSTTQIYQLSLHSALSTHRHAGRYAGSYDLEVTFDLEKILRIPGGTFYVSAEGSWSDGLDASSIGSLFGVNADAGGYRGADVSQAYWEQSLMNGRLQFRIGKLDLTGGFECRGCPVAFDASAYANDETSQFLNAALVNNPTIPFPDSGLGAAVFLMPTEYWYLSAGAADAQADVRETGFNTAFHDEDYFFAIFETGAVVDMPSLTGPTPAMYRIGFWYDPQPKQRHHGRSVKRDDTGFYLSADQMVLKENADPNDSQGLGMFIRYGLADSDVSDIKCFYSAGVQYKGLVPTRDDDVLGIGFAKGRLVRDAGFAKEHESVLEVYYNVHVMPWVSISPSLQYIWNPGGADGVGNAFVAGIRVQMSF